MSGVDTPLRRPTVLVLVVGQEESAEVQRALRRQGAIPIAIRPRGAVAAMAHYMPSAVVIDLAHLATAPDDFLAAAEASRVDVVCIGATGARPLSGIRKADRDGRSPPGLTHRVHAPAVRLGEVLHDGESEPGASLRPRPRGIHAVESLENPRQVLA